jgi:hypothetical protein
LRFKYNKPKRPANEGTAAKERKERKKKQTANAHELTRI